MGSTSARDMQENSGLDRDAILTWHLTCNHYPPIPTSMVPVCERAIELAQDGDWDTEVELPDGVHFRGRNTAPVSEIVKHHHLHDFLIPEED